MAQAITTEFRELTDSEIEMVSGGADFFSALTGVIQGALGGALLGMQSAQQSGLGTLGTLGTAAGGAIAGASAASGK